MDSQDLELLAIAKKWLLVPDPSGIYHQHAQQIIDKLQEMSKKKAYLVTINWDPAHSVDSLQKVFNKVLQKKWLKNISYTHEQRGEILPHLGNGYHIHILIEDSDKTTFQVHREIYNTVKAYVGNKKHVDVQPVKPDWIQDKRDYISGKKFDPEKEDKLTLDTIFRRKYHLINKRPANGDTPPAPEGGFHVSPA